MREDRATASEPQGRRNDGGCIRERRPYTYAARSLGPSAGFFVAWLFILFEPLVAPFWIAIAWVGIGIALTVWISMTRPDKLRDMERVYVEDESEPPEARAATFPVA